MWREMYINFVTSFFNRTLILLCSLVCVQYEYEHFLVWGFAPSAIPCFPCAPTCLMPLLSIIPFKTRRNFIELNWKNTHNITLALKVVGLTLGGLGEWREKRNCWNTIRKRKVYKRWEMQNKLEIARKKRETVQLTHRKNRKTTTSTISTAIGKAWFHSLSKINIENKQLWKMRTHFR